MSLVPWWCLFLHVLGCHSHVYKHGNAWNGYEFHTYPHPAKRPGVPRDTMVDVTNNLGLKLLAIHNEYNENNIAISPYGALSVLIALGEGLEGDAVYEIQQAANIPHDISIIRVGLRDVHRHLKSYFIPKEGFLAGLTLNHENVTLRPKYEDILKFYGYDTIAFNSALYPDPDTTEKPQSTYGQVTTTEDAPTVPTTEIGKIETNYESTTEILARATTEAEATTATDASETTTTLAPETSTTEQSTVALPTTQEISTTTSLPQTTTAAMEARTETTTKIPTTTTELTTVSSTVKSTTTEMPTTSEIITTEATIITSTNQLSTTEEITEETTTQSARSTRSIPTTMMSTTEPLTTSVVTEASTTTQSATSTRSIPTTIIMGTTEPLTTSVATEDSTTSTSTESDSTTQDLLTTPLASTTTNLPTTPEPTTQSIATTISLLSDTDADTTTSTTFTVPFTSTANSNEDTSTTTVTTAEDTSTSVTTTTSGDTTTDNNDSSSTMNTISDESTENLINKDNEIGDASADEEGFGGASIRTSRSGQTNVVELNMKEATGYKPKSKRRSRSVLDYLIARYYDDHYDAPHLNHRPYIPKEQLSFLVNEKYREYDINFMKYDTVLPFHYVPHLNALALSFPLDSTKYYLLLLLPADETGIDKLVCDLRLNGSLRYIIANLRYTHVVATIPSFMLKGYVTLTPSFQKLGIRKVFEPRQADFSPMTNQRGIYVTNIEQAITVTIRNYVDPNTIEHHRNLRRYDPVHFKADHPFLYFVIDSEIHVTLMAGKIVNPLNSRIS